ncbi:cysteine desulfurase NifS [Geitlerinema sp. P-1104]|uniref:cysteine desulfurase NifS n=1 Tax=Geitlerinema sp. P-1104 TaxID=2546230 RepID=UPI0014775346|nr:cysteine desulfurase NifS [Geitlerinema sp. P-1104]NMG57702.1 cysteine desulfurase NifS [Geitlerinema sp. P-1104]
MSVIYLDNNATTCVAPEVYEAMSPYFTQFYGNPSSMHRFGGQVARGLRQSREAIAALIQAEPNEIIFTSCGTEGDNAAIRAALDSQPDKRHIITTAVEHPAILKPLQRLEKQGYTVTYLGVDGKGQLKLNELRRAIRDDTALISVMAANNETGTIFPIERIGHLAKERGILFHVDAVQAAGKIPLDVSSGVIDFLVLSGHKFHGPKGVGVLYVRRGVRFRPLLAGGHQERGRRGGTENVPGIIGLGKAAELTLKTFDEDHTRVSQLRDRLEQGILSTISDTQRNGHPGLRLPNTANIGFKYVEGEAILLSLDREGICASSGSACTSGSLQPSHVLRAMGLPYTLLHGSIRFSLSRYTTGAEIEQVLGVISPMIGRLRDLSPFSRDNEATHPWLQEQTQRVGIA